MVILNYHSSEVKLSQSTAALKMSTSLFHDETPAAWVVSNRWTGLWTGSLDWICWTGLLDWIAGLDSEERSQTSMQDCMCSEDLCQGHTDVAEPRKRGARVTINLN